MKSLYKMNVRNREYYAGYIVIIGKRPLAKLFGAELEIAFRKAFNLL